MHVARHLDQRTGSTPEHRLVFLPCSSQRCLLLPGRCFFTLGSGRSVSVPKTAHPRGVRNNTDEDHMPTKSVPGRKLRDLIILHGFYQPSLRELGNLLRLSSSTVKKYLLAFKTSSLSLTEIQGLSDPALQERLTPLRSNLQNYRQDKI